MEVGEVVHTLVSWTHSTPADFRWELWGKNAANNRAWVPSSSTVNYTCHFSITLQNSRGSTFIASKWINYIKRVFTRYSGKAFNFEVTVCHLQQKPRSSPLLDTRSPQWGSVAVVEPDSAVTRPQIWQGRCLRVEGDHFITAPFQEIAPNVYAFSVGKGRERYIWGMLSAQLTLYTAQPTTLIDWEPRKQKSRVIGLGHGLGNLLQYFFYLAWNMAHCNL